MLRPKDITQKLAISPATLRLWSNHFSVHLSPSAQATLTEKGTPAQRRYTEEDLSVFLRAQSLLSLGLTYEEAAAKLAEAPVGAPLAIRTNGALAPASESTTEPHNGYLAVPEVAEMVSLLKRQNELSEEILLSLRTIAERPVVPTPWERLLSRLGF